MGIKLYLCLEYVNTILVKICSQNIYVYTEHIPSATLTMLDTPDLFSK